MGVLKWGDKNTPKDCSIGVEKHNVSEVSTFLNDVLTTIYSIFHKKATLYIVFYGIKT